MPVGHLVITHCLVFISKNILPSYISFLSYYQFIILFFGILSLFLPMHFLGFNVMARRIPDYPDSFHSWNFLSSIGSGIIIISFITLQKTMTENSTETLPSRPHLSNSYHTRTLPSYFGIDLWVLVRSLYEEIYMEVVPEIYSYIEFITKYYK